MTISRRRFLGQAMPLGLLPLGVACAAEMQEPGAGVMGLEPGDVFRHGVASGDPLTDAVILWTRVTLPENVAERGVGEVVEVEWRVARDPALADVVATGQALASPEADHCVKVDATGLSPDSVYYYDFGALGARSPVGRTKTLPAAGAARARLAVVSCANYPAGYFTVYRLLAARDDLDLVLHLGDYLYEYANGTYGDGTAIGRVPEPDREIVSLADYRARHAQYKTDADLQELHRQHPMIAIWDDHEIANNGFRDGAANHQPGEGDWAYRKQSAMRAYFEWLPIRDGGGQPRVYRQFAFGDLFDLVTLDTRYAARPAPVSRSCDGAALDDAARLLLGAEQEAWLFESLRASRARGARWRLVAQQVMLAQLSDPREGCATEVDQWDGYAASRARLLGVLRDEAVNNVVVLTGDAHSAWAFDLADNPFDPAVYDPASGAGSLAVEIIAPSVTSPYDFGGGSASNASHPHLKFVDRVRHGYVLVDVTPERTQAEWYFASSVLEPSADESLGAVFEVRAGENRLRVAAAASLSRGGAPRAPG
jgi:alkaline phosphatase D